MKVELSAEVQAKLDRLALEAGTTPQQMVVETVIGFVNGETSGLAKLTVPSAPGGGGNTEPEVDSRGKILPARHLAGGIITPQ